MEPKIITELSAAADGNFNDLPALLRRTMAAYNAIAAELADQVRVTEEHQRLRYQCEIENTRLTTDAQRDYEGMREFQAKFIAADHRLRALEAALRPLAMAAKSWHDFHHDDAGFSAVQCDEICKALPTALAILTSSETKGDAT